MNKRAVWIGIILLVVSILSLNNVLAGWCEANEFCQVTTDQCSTGEYAVPIESGYGYCNGCFCEEIVLPEDPTPQELCTAQKGIYCSNGEGYCLVPDNLDNVNINCVVSLSQTIDTQTNLETKYYANTLTINSGVKLSFFNSAQTLEGGSISTGAPGNSEAGGSGGAPAGNGGDGGAVLNKGMSGTGEHHACEGCNLYCGYKSAGRGGNPGALISFSVMEKLTNDGIISVDGKNGQNGLGGEASCSGWGARWGNYGTGGGGGGGAGKLTITTVEIAGTGLFSAKGGNNGYGGVGGTQRTENGNNDCDGNQWENDCGAPAGYGGAGDGGNINIYANIVADIFKEDNSEGHDVSGGIMSRNTAGHQCFDDETNCNARLVTYKKIDGAKGVYAVSPPGANEITNLAGIPIDNACNNALDDDGDGFIDMADSDCYNINTDPHPYYCPSSNHGYFGAWYPELKNDPYFAQSMLNGSDGCCGDDFLHPDFGWSQYSYLADYGFIHNINNRQQYMCYQDNINLQGTSFINPSWLNAVQERYKIKTVKTFTGDIDTISNSSDWYYCNANNNNALSGNPIAEGGTFSGEFSVGEYSCADLFNNFLGLYDDNIFYETCVNSDPEGDNNEPYSHNCCEAIGGEIATISNSGCDLICFMAGSGNALPPPTQGEIIIPTDDEYILSDICTGDYETIDACLAALESLNSGGNIIIGSSESDFDINYYNYISSHIGYVSKESFICFKENNSNIISECCFDGSCENNNYRLADSISGQYKRVLTKGSTIHTLENYDTFTSDHNNLLERLRVFRFNSVSPSPFIISSNSNNNLVNLQEFSSLEFDMLSDTADMTLHFNGVDLGDVYKFSNNGVKSGKWHHIIIPITGDMGHDFTGIRFSTSDAEERIIIIDNLILVAEGDDLEHNTQNYYCTGGFGSWVFDLDPSNADRTLGTFEALGPHHVACVGNPAYSWTGNYCCGDDTRKTGQTDGIEEYFNDTQGGCFAGSKVRNDSSVAYAKGYIESTDKSKDELDSYPHKNLIYINNSFLGCQVPGNDIDIDRLYGATPPNVDLITYPQDYVKSQCQVVGSYYCKDGAWRQKISTDTNLDSFNDDNKFTALNEDGTPIYPQPITLKFAPSGVELIQNGFRTTPSGNELP